MTEASEIVKFLRHTMGAAILCGLLLTGCSDKPKECISERKMVRLMADMQLAEAYANTVGLSRYGDHDERSEVGRGVLAAHGVTQEELDSTLAWYGRNIDKYSDLYEKVDKEIISRKMGIMRDGRDQGIINSTDMLWPYQTHGLLSTLGNTDAWILSIESPSLDKGDILEWTMKLSEMAQVNGVLGVEYEDGTADAYSQILTGNRQKYEMKLPTDTGKNVRRIYGFVRLRDNSQKPIFADSIMLRKMPFDSIEYVRHRSLRHYGRPTVTKTKAARKDTVRKDSIKMFKLPEFDDNLMPTQSSDQSKPDKQNRIRPVKPIRENAKKQ